MSQEIYLVLSATGRQGSAVVDALVANNANVFGSSRNPESLRKIRGMFSVSQTNWFVENICSPTPLLNFSGSSPTTNSQEVQLKSSTPI